MFELKGMFGRRWIGIAGGKAIMGNIDEVFKELTSVDRKHGTISQIFDASCIAGKGHLLHGVRLALIAQATGKNFAGSLNIELACWVSGERQINRAFEKVGMHEGDRTVAILTVGKTRVGVRRALSDILRELHVERDDDVLELAPGKIPKLLKIFSISKRELDIANVQKLVLERIALLSLQQ